MRRVPVISSNIAEIGYNESSQTLEILFRSGTVYQYFGVPNRVHRGLMNAVSHGQYLHQEIKGRYRYTRI